MLLCPPPGSAVESSLSSASLRSCTTAAWETRTSHQGSEHFIYSSALSPPLLIQLWRPFFKCPSGDLEDNATEHFHYIACQLRPLNIHKLESGLRSEGWINLLLNTFTCTSLVPSNCCCQKMISMKVWYELQNNAVHYKTAYQKSFSAAEERKTNNTLSYLMLQPLWGLCFFFRNFTDLSYIKNVKCIFVGQPGS